jgi:integrase/recombinase XerC
MNGSTPHGAIAAPGAGALSAPRHGASGAVAPNGPQPGHNLGEVTDDWAAVAVWLSSVDGGGGRGAETLKTYSFHLTKVRWYCERELGRPPSAWTLQEVDAFRQYLAALPASSLRAAGDEPGPDRPPFTRQPAKGSQSDILRFVKAMFGGLHDNGYLRLNPMKSVKARKARRIDKKRAVGDDLFDLVLRVMDEAPRATQKDHQLLLRDRFVFICLREAGLRTSELVGARMTAFRPLYDPATASTYWVLTVEAHTAKGGKERTVPVTPALLDALVAYRRAFGLDPLPGTGAAASGERHGLVLSVRTTKHATGDKVRTASDRRVFAQWRDVGTRQGLYDIVKGRVREAVERLERSGDAAAAAQLARVSAHWLRHTFAMAQLMEGRDLRTVATSLGHASVNTTMAYTEQDAIDQIRNWESERPGSVAMAARTVAGGVGEGAVW